MPVLRSIWCVLLAAVIFSTFGCSNPPSLPTSRVGSEPGSIEAASYREIEPSPIVSVTPEAVRSVTRIAKQQGLADPWYLRVSVVPGGCCGFLHKLDLDPVSSPSDDHTFESSGIRVVVLKRQVEMLRGAQVHYGEANKERGFIIKNPNFEGEPLKKWLPILRGEAPPAPKLTAAQLKERIAQFRKLADDDPENELGHFRLGQLLMEDEQYTEAAKSFDRTLELSPQFSKVYELLGESLIKLGNKERAVVVLTKGWTTADERGDDATRDTMANLLSELGAAVPLGVSNRKSK